MKRLLATTLAVSSFTFIRSEPPSQTKPDFNRVESFTLGATYHDVYHALLKRYDAEKIDRRRWSYDGMEKGRAFLLFDRQENKRIDFDFYEDKLISILCVQLREDGFEEAERLRKQWTDLYGDPVITPAEETAGAEPVIWVARWTDGNVQRFLSPFMVDWTRRGVSYGVKRTDHIDDGPHTIHYY